MNLPSHKAKKHPLVTALQGPAGLYQSQEFIMQQKQSPWQVAHAQAKNIKKLKNPAAKRRQIVLWCQMIKLAMKGGQ